MRHIIRGRRVFGSFALVGLLLPTLTSSLLAAEPQPASSLPVPPSQPPSIHTPPPGGASTLYIREYRVKGATKLPAAEVEEAVYPYLGPGRTTDDVEHARAALEKAFQDKGYQTVTVDIPAQEPRGGVVYLQVNEAAVGQLRVTGSRYFSLSQIKAGVPSLAPGQVPNFNEVSKQIVALNQLPDRQITPTLRPGLDPGTVDIDLNVKDTFPLHGSLELNNRYSIDTTPLRLNGAISYNNLWQLGHTLGFSFQIAPERLSDAEIFSGYYIARIPQVDWFSFMVQGTRQNSNVSTLGGGAVAGNGTTAGVRAVFTLPVPNTTGFYHSLSFGLDYKDYSQDLTTAGQDTSAPVTYWPFTVAYNAALSGKGYNSELNAQVVASFRGVGSTQQQFDNRRYNSDGGFLYFRGDVSHTQDLPFGFQAYGQFQGQVANEPLVDTEQFALGGLDTVRGYLEAQELGDNGFAGTAELRTPSVPHVLGIDEWRLYGFFDGGATSILDPLPQQTSSWNLASVGAGTRLHLFNYINSSLDAGVPLVSQQDSPAGQWRLTFRIWGEF